MGDSKRAEQRRANLGRSAEAREQRDVARTEDAIQEGQAAGAFERLPGQGKPYRPDPTSQLGALHDEWLSLKILKNSGFAPTWVELGRVLERVRGEARQLAERWRKAPADLQSDLRPTVERLWMEENALIRKWNEVVPEPTLQRYAMPIGRRWERLVEGTAERDT